MVVRLMRPDWVAQYVGIPFVEKGRDRAGCDCWGLVRLILHEQFGVELPSYVEAYATTNDGEEIGRLVSREAPQLGHAVPPANARLGDVVFLRIKGEPHHCGLVLEAGLMVHIHQDINAVQERYDGLLWRNRIVGLYRADALTGVSSPCVVNT